MMRFFTRISCVAIIVAGATLLSATPVTSQAVNASVLNGRNNDGNDNDKKPAKRNAKTDAVNTDKPTRVKRRSAATAKPAKTVETTTKSTTTTAKARATFSNYAVVSPVGERVLVEVHIGRFASKSMLAFEQPDGELLVPVMPILKLAGVDARIQNEKLQGRQSSTGPKFSFDVRTKELRHGDDSWLVPSEHVARNKEGLWVTVRFLKKLIGTDASYDQGSADLEIREGERFPVGVRALRDASILAQRAKLAESKHAMAPIISSDSDEYSLRNRAVVIDYQLTHNLQPQGVLSSGSSAHSDFETAIGASFPAFRGVMNVRTTTAGSFGTFDSNMWWTLTRATNSLVSEINLGNVRTRGFQSREMLGFYVTNGDPVPDLNAGQTQYALRLPSNWQLDAFRGSNLISTSLRADGEHTLPVELSYGTNTIDFIAHGPDGQERIFQRSFHTPSMYVTPHELDYAVAGGLCEETAVCSARMNADLRLGITSNLVVRAGVDGRLRSFKKSPLVPTAISASALIPYAGVSAVFNRSTVVDASIQPAVGSSGRSDGAMQIRFEPNPNFILSSDVSSVSTPLYRGTIASSLVDSSAVTQREFSDWMRSNRVAAYLHYAPSFTRDHASIEAWTSVQSWNTAKAASSRFGLSAQALSLQFRPYIRFEHRKAAESSNSVLNALDDVQAETSTRTRSAFQGIDLTYVPMFTKAASFGEWWVRGSLETRRSQVDNWTASLTRAFGHWRVDGALLKRSGVSGHSWTLSVVSELPQFQTANFSSSSTANSRATSITQVQGSAIYDGELRRLSLSAEPATGRAGVAGVIFLDANNDGIKQSNEAPIPDVQLYVNNKSLVSDKRGSFMVWGLPGYTTQQILVDTSSLADPTWIPVQPLSMVKTLAGTLVTANIPVVIAGTLHGSIRSIAPVAATDSTRTDSATNDSTGVQWNHPVQLVLANVRTGIRRLVDTFSDGTFYEEGLAPGEYLISVDAASLIGSGLVSTPVNTRINAGRPVQKLNGSANKTPPDETDVVLWLRPGKR